MKVEIYTTIRRVEGLEDYAVKLVDYFKQVEENGFTGTLIFQSNTNDIEPWVLAQQLLSCSRSIIPFIAVNPMYMHPYTAAQKILSFSKLYNRKVNLNFIAGTSLSDLESMSMLLDKNERYDRLVEYIEIVMALLTKPTPLTYSGKHYQAKNLKLSSTIEPSHIPGVFIAGSSDSAIQARARLNAGSIEMAKPLKGFADGYPVAKVLHIGVMACETKEDAQNKLTNKFRAQYEESAELLELSMLNSDSQWKKQLFHEQEDEVFTMLPFRNFNSDCPYLAGDYAQVADYLFEYLQKGAEHFIIEVDSEDMHGLKIVMDRLHEMVGIEEFLI